MKKRIFSKLLRWTFATQAVGCLATLPAYADLPMKIFQAEESFGLVVPDRDTTISAEVELMVPTLGLSDSVSVRGGCEQRNASNHSERQNRIIDRIRSKSGNGDRDRGIRRFCKICDFQY